MYDIDSIDTQNQSVTATVCENAQLFGAAPERDEFDPPRRLGPRRRAQRSRRGVPHHGRRRRSGRHPARRRAREHALGVRQHARRPGAAPRPQRRPARARNPRPAARPGRHRDQREGAGADDAPRAELRRPPRRVRADARRSRRRLPPRDRRHLAAAAAGRTRARPGTSPRPPSTHATSCARGRTARPGRTCPRERWSPSRAARR